MFNAGMITQQDVDEMNALADENARLKDIVDNLIDDDEEWFPIYVTATDSSNACTWNERTWDENGVRIDHPNGLSGSPTYMPAYPVGNGTLPIVQFPFDTWARRRITTSSIGAVFEFDWICACGSMNTASGSGGSTGSPVSGASGA